jgi:hypothetical protein
MARSTNIGSIYDYPSSITVFRRTERQVAISLGGKCLILCPSEWNHGGTIFPLAGASEDGIKLLLSTPTESEAVASFGELLAWASRRPSSEVTRHLFDPEREAPVSITIRTRHGPQRVYGYPFDRWLIREALQTFVESDCPSDQRLELRIAPVGGGAHPAGRRPSDYGHCDVTVAGNALW